MMGENVVHALKSISLQIEARQIVALRGPSGSGKSTLLNLIGALDSPTSGVIKIGGRELQSLSVNERADFRNATVGFVFQNFNLIPVLSTYENVILPCQLGQLSDSARDFDFEQRARELIEKVGLYYQMHQRVNKLSGGQMQRVALARALVNKPNLILADEPTANLDSDTANTVLSLMRELSLSEGSTVLVATHDSNVLKYCDRVITLKDGGITSDTSVDDDMYKAV
jgi:putative ABC transport system ATP-binding protein